MDGNVHDGTDNRIHTAIWVVTTYSIPWVLCVWLSKMAHDVWDNLIMSRNRRARGLMAAWGTDVWDVDVTNHVIMYRVYD